MPKDYQIGALWIGGSLSYLEQLCLKSFLDAGQHVRLYVYGSVDNVPQGVEIADAAQVLPMDTAIRHTRTGSPAPQADRFRYHLLAQTDDVIWADTDAYCVQPFTTDTGHFHGWESAHHVNNGVLGLPRDSDTLGALIAFTSDEFAIPEWLSGAEQDRLRALKDAGRPVGVGDQQWGAWGPRALTHFLHKTGEIRHALPRDALYPIGFKERGIMVRADGNAERFITPQTRSIHFYGRRMRARLQDMGGVPPARSLIGRLLDKHGIDPAAAPLPDPPPAPQRLQPEDRHGRGLLNLTDLADAAGLDRGSARHGYTDLYQMLFFALRRRKLKIGLVGLDGGVGVSAPEAWAEAAERTVAFWRAYFPDAEFFAFDRPDTAPQGVSYCQTALDEVDEIARGAPDRLDIVIDDATHASHHQQNALRALFPRLCHGGLYVVEDLRSQPTPLEKQGVVKTAALFQGYLETGVFDHPDPQAALDFNAMRADVSGCFLFQARFQKHRRDQMLVLHKR